jgi:hypothetical protein
MNIFKQQIDYLKDNPNGYWFKRKLYGWGWTPCTWQGWVMVLGYIAIVLTIALTADDTIPTEDAFLTIIGPVIALTAILIAICYKKGEKPKWQWGIKK